MASSSVKFTSKLSGAWLTATSGQLDAAVLEMATDIDKRAKILAPRDTGALVNSGRIQKVSAAFYRIIFGSSRVPYARRRHFENRRTPSSIGYLAKAGDSVSRGSLNKYLRQ